MLKHYISFIRWRLIILFLKLNEINYKITRAPFDFFGAFSLSFGGLIVKSFEGSTLWQILFWRSVFFIIVVLLFLIISYKQNFISAFYKSGIPGLIGGIILACGFSGYVFAMYNTTVANTNFIIQTQTLFLAIFGSVSYTHLTLPTIYSV